MYTASQYKLDISDNIFPAVEIYPIGLFKEIITVNLVQNYLLLMDIQFIFFFIQTFHFFVHSKRWKQS